MNWAVIRPALLAAVQTATGLTGVNAVAWKGSKEASGMRPPVIADLSISGPGSVGRDELRRTYNSTTNQKDVQTSGQRKFSLVVRVETQDGSDSGIALGYVDKVRSRLKWPTIAASLRAVSVSVASFHDTQTLDNVKIQNRIVSVAVMEILMNGVENDVDTMTGDGNWIESVEISNATDGNGNSLLVDEAGNPIQVQIEVTT